MLAFRQQRHLGPLTIGRRFCVRAAGPSKAYKHIHKRSLGQNFLVDELVAASIAQEADIRPGDLVLEIGPGTGSLTAELLKHGAKVTAIELDASLVPRLVSTFDEAVRAGRLKIIAGDATRLNVLEIMPDLQRAGRKAKVVANLPFNITTAILKTLLPLGDLLSEVFVMLQLEAANRLTGAENDDSTYRAMSVLVEYHSWPSLGRLISRTAFQPRPNVDCAMARFKLRTEAEKMPVPSEAALTRLVNICFNSRRKTVRNSLKSVFDPTIVSNVLSELDLDPNVRPQQMQMKDFVALCQHLM